MKVLFNFAALMLVAIVMPVHALSDLDYLPKNISYDPKVPIPESILGAPVGEWHVRHDQLVNYMYAIANSSDRVSIVETGRTHENRPLLLLAFSSAENQQNLKSIQANHIKSIETGASNSDSPLVIWMGYSVHGNEPSGSNAALLIAYYLAAGQGAEVESLLNDNVVLIDPSLNPDGLSRFAHWANMHKSKNLVADPNNREHIEDWPSGRTNHYWFDLNRDWLLLTHPESKARIAEYHQWRPHVLTDFHEMGPNSTYFFQPGIPSRKNPWTPDRNVELTQALANFHAQALDANKQLYFSGESFDDFYYGKGSTYPDAHGTIGILFEQSSSRGHLQNTINGPKHFSETIQNQVTTSLSTFKGSLANKKALIDYQTSFKEQTDELVKEEKLRGYLLTERQDSTRFDKLKSILKQHQIDFSYLSKQAKYDDQVYDPAHTIFVPLQQSQYRLIKSLFSVRQRFNDNTFYDVSNWNLALAFNIEYKEVKRDLWRRLSLTKSYGDNTVNSVQQLPENAYAYAFSWQNYNAPKLLHRLLEEQVQVRVSGQAFAATTSQGKVSFAAGTVLIPAALKQPGEIEKLLLKHAEGLNVKLWAIQSGLTSQGSDLGSSKMKPVKLPKTLIVGGKGVSQYEVGEAWHYLDTRVGMPVSIVEMNRLDSITFAHYTHIIWVQGNYKKISESVSNKIEAWVKAGGILIGQKSAAKWFDSMGWLKASYLKDKEVEQVFDTENLKYQDIEAYKAKQRIAGAVYETVLDLSHPLAFGYNRSLLPVFRNSTSVMLEPLKPFVSVAKYVKEPLMAGYSADELQQLIGGSSAVVAHNLGKGKVIAFADNPNFRGYWYGTSRLLSNAIFMASFINAEG